MECEGCTACCTFLVIKEINKPLNTKCQYCDNGCTIYNSKPSTCSEFRCAYLDGKNIPKTLRPDNCGVIFFKKTDRIFVAAILNNKEVTPIAYQQIEAFKKQGYSIVILDNKIQIALSEGHNPEEIYNEYIEAIRGNI